MFSHFAVVIAKFQSAMETHIKNTLVNFESNYYQGKPGYRTVAKIAKNFDETGYNNYVQSFCETLFRLWQHDL